MVIKLAWPLLLARRLSGEEGGDTRFHSDESLSLLLLLGRVLLLLFDFFPLEESFPIFYERQKEGTNEIFAAPRVFYVRCVDGLVLSKEFVWLLLVSSTQKAVDTVKVLPTLYYSTAWCGVLVVAAGVVRQESSFNKQCHHRRVLVAGVKLRLRRSSDIPVRPQIFESSMRRVRVQMD